MKIKILVVVLAVVCLGLAAALFATKKQAEDQRRATDEKIEGYSKQAKIDNDHLTELRLLHVQLTNDLATGQQQAAGLSNTIASANALLEQNKTSLASAQTQIENMTSKIASLETENKVLEQRTNDLALTITKLNGTIEDTLSQLAIAQTNRLFLEQKLSLEMAQKAELERKFNDLGELRAQVSKIREEMFVARRMQLMKNDNSGKKGAELLIQRTPAPASAANSSPNSNLNVEVGSDGSVKVIPPLDNKK